MSQSITHMDAGTQRDEYGEYEIIEHNGYTVKHIGCVLASMCVSDCDMIVASLIVMIVCL